MSPATPSERLARHAEEFWRFCCREYPAAALLAGEAIEEPTLFREGPADHERRYAAAGRMLADVGAIDGARLEGADSATHALLRGELAEIRNLYEVLDHSRPALLPVGPDFAAVHFANCTSIADPGAAERYVARLATVPDFLLDLEENLREGHRRGLRYPRVVLDAAVRAAQAALSVPIEATPWYGPFRRSPAPGGKSAARLAQQLEGIIRDRLLPAQRRYVECLAGTLAEGARATIACSDAPGGRDYYLAQVRRYTSTDLDPDEIHDLGWQDVTRLESAIEAVAAQAGHAGNVAAYRQFLATDPQFVAASPQALLEQAQVLAKRIDKRIPAFFGRLPRITYGAETMSAAQSEVMPPAYAQANPADRSGPGIFWLTGLPARCPTYLLLPLVLHEAWPGHLMHLALVQEMDGLPTFRRHRSQRYSACLEGWALYCESLGAEMGLYESPHQHYGRLEMELWRALRLVVDTGIHWRGWSREQAVECMAARLALSRATVEAEVDRYIGLPGQALAYQIGNVRIRALRRRSEEVLGGRFDLREFHDTLLAAGPVSLPVLGGHVERWLALRAAA